MIWLVWRAHRAALISALVVLSLAAVFMVVMGLMVRADFMSMRVASCRVPPISDTCAHAQMDFSQKYALLKVLRYTLFPLIPLAAGVLVGAPLVARELERKTSLLVWTQGVTRTRWLAGMLLGIFAGVLALSAAFSALCQWGLDPFIQAYGRFSQETFDIIGVAPVAYAAFAVALGIAAGALFGKTLPAILVMFLVFLPVRMTCEYAVRPYHLIAPVVENVDFLAANNGDFLGNRQTTDWVLEGPLIVDSSGNPLDLNTQSKACPWATPDPKTGKDSYAQCLHNHGWTQRTIYHPDTHFWPLQFAEAGVFTTLAVALLALTFVVLRRRDA